MDALSRRLFLKLLLFSPTLTGCYSYKNTVKKLLYTSDVHVALPEGRLSFMTQRYEDFLKKYSNENCMLFINGDFIDNAYVRDGKVVGGGYVYQEKETKYFLAKTVKFFSEHKKDLLLNFGSGHDFGNLSLSEKLTKQTRIGRYLWGGIDLIWFTVQKSAFSANKPIKSNVLSQDEYTKLESLLATSNNCILFSHIPFRTQKSYRLGKWPGERNLTIPSSDKIYEIVKKYSDRIIAIFKGHIHESYKSYYYDIPLFSFPFIQNNSYCEIIQHINHIEIISKNSKVDNENIFFNKIL
jgi:hypothetical protein